MKKFLTIFVFIFTFIKPISAEESIKVAAFMPLSGSYAANGYYTQAGVNLAIKNLRETGINLKVTFEDVCLANQAISSLKSKLADSNFKGVVANYCVLSLAAMKNILEKYKLTTFHNSIVPENLIDNKVTFTTFPTADEESRVIADYAVNKLGAKTAAVLYLSSQWGIGYRDSFKKYFEDLGGKVVIEEEQGIGASDFRPELTRIKNANVDIIFPVHAGAELVLALKQINSLGIKSNLITASEAYDDSIINGAKNHANGLTFFIPKLNTNNQYVKEISTEYIKNKKSLRPLTSHAYVSTIIFAKAYFTCKDDQKCLSSYIKEAINNVRGGESWDPTKFQRVEIRNQEFIKIVN